MARTDCDGMGWDGGLNLFVFVFVRRMDGWVGGWVWYGIKDKVGALRISICSQLVW